MLRSTLSHHAVLRQVLQVPSARRTDAERWTCCGQHAAATWDREMLCSAAARAPANRSQIHFDNISWLSTFASWSMEFASRSQATPILCCASKSWIKHRLLILADVSDSSSVATRSRLSMVLSLEKRQHDTRSRNTCICSDAYRRTLNHSNKSTGAAHQACCTFDGRKAPDATLSVQAASATAAPCCHLKAMQPSALPPPVQARCSLTLLVRVGALQTVVSAVIAQALVHWS